jgi:hypothetical protein
MSVSLTKQENWKTKGKRGKREGKRENEVGACKRPNFGLKKKTNKKILKIQDEWVNMTGVLLYFLFRCASPVV